MFAFINDIGKEIVKDVVGQKIYYFPISQIKTRVHDIYDIIVMDINYDCFFCNERKRHKREPVVIRTEKRKNVINLSYGFLENI